MRQKLALRGVRKIALKVASLGHEPARGATSSMKAFVGPSTGGGTVRNINAEPMNQQIEIPCDLDTSALAGSSSGGCNPSKKLEVSIPILGNGSDSNVRPPPSIGEIRESNQQ